MSSCGAGSGTSAANRSVSATPVTSSDTATAKSWNFGDMPTSTFAWYAPPSGVRTKHGSGLWANLLRSSALPWSLILMMSVEKLADFSTVSFQYPCAFGSPTWALASKSFWYLSLQERL